MHKNLLSRAEESVSAFISVYIHLYVAKGTLISVENILVKRVSD